MTMVEGQRMCRLEWLLPDGTWYLAHHGVPLLHPQRYVERLRQHSGKIGRVTILETGEVIQAEGYEFI